MYPPDGMITFISHIQKIICKRHALRIVKGSIRTITIYKARGFTAILTQHMSLR